MSLVILILCLLILLIEAKTHEKLNLITERLKTMPTQAEEAAILQEFVAQLNKAKAEINQKITDLETAVANAGVTSAEVDAATAAAREAAQGLDDIVPDQPTP